MAEYRVYVLDERGHITSPAHIIKCKDDDEATRRARQYLDGKPAAEVWNGSRRVARIRAPKLTEWINSPGLRPPG